MLVGTDICARRREKAKRKDPRRPDDITMALQSCLDCPGPEKLSPPVTVDLQPPKAGEPDTWSGETVPFAGSPAKPDANAPAERDGGVNPAAPAGGVSAPPAKSRAKEKTMEKDKCETPGCEGPAAVKGFCGPCWGQKVAEGKRKAAEERTGVKELRGVELVPVPCSKCGERSPMVGQNGQVLAWCRECFAEAGRSNKVVNPMKAAVLNEVRRAQEHLRRTLDEIATDRVRVAIAAQGLLTALDVAEAARVLPKSEGQG
jgi:hypothetical protein